MRAPHAELLGLKHAFEAGQIASRQYVDLVSGDYPTTAADSSDQSKMLPEETESTPAQSHSERHKGPESPIPAPVSDAAPSAPVVDSGFDDDVVDEPSTVVDKSPADESTYGPVRRRVHGKNGPQAFYRPSPMRPDDFSEMMEETMPRLEEQVIQDSAAIDSSMQSSSPRGTGSKRAHSPDQSEAQGPSQVPRTDAASAAGESSRPASEVLSCSKHVSQLSRADQDELVNMFHKGTPIEVMLASYMQKKSSKEIPHVNQEPEQQRKIDGAELAEWHVIEGKHAGRLVLGEEAQQVRQKLAH